MPDRHIEAVSFLKRDMLKHITMLKLLHAYGTALTCHYVEREGAAGVALSYPPALFPYDAATYPNATQIGVLATSGQAAAEALLDQIPANGVLVFKLVDTADQDAVARRFALRRTMGFVSYRNPAGTVWPTVPEVAVSQSLDAYCLDVFVSQGHSRDEVRGHFDTGRASLFVARVEGESASLCYVFENFGRVWEIASVYTSPTLRRAGYGRRVVAAALHHLSQQGHIPRYQVHEANTASIRLAETLGLVPFVTIQHFYAKRRSSSAEQLR